jgi:hypothetical protein
MTSPRPTNPRRWTGLALASVTLAATGPVAAQIRLPDLAIYTPAPDAQLWTVQAEGGEGGEAGAIAGVAPDVAYLAQLSIVEGHLVAAANLYSKGMVDEAVGLSYHPEAEMMDAVRESLTAHGAADFTPEMTAFSGTLEAGATAADVATALTTFRTAVATAAAAGSTEPRVRLDAMVTVLRAAASEYAGSIEAGAVNDVMAYHEAHAFVAVARDLAKTLTADSKAAAAAEKALTAMTAADEAFGDMTLAKVEARDPAILLAVAARAELAASTVR